MKTGKSDFCAKYTKSILCEKDDKEWKYLDILQEKRDNNFFPKIVLVKK